MIDWSIEWMIDGMILIFYQKSEKIFDAKNLNFGAARALARSFEGLKGYLDGFLNSFS